jgi:tripartite-type tricarboxylate transporter receptor subunit TctC
MFGRVHVFAWIACCLFGSPACAASDFPNRPIRVIIPFAAGGSTDFVARFMDTPFNERTGQRLIIENRGGASSILGTMNVVQAKPDGYTVLLTSSSYVVNTVTYKHLPYDAFKDLVPVSLLARGPLVLVVHRSTGIGSVAQLIDEARKNPGKMTYASGGTGSPPHLGAELFQMETGTKMLHVPYKGSGAAMADLSGGHVELMFAGFSQAKSFVESGQFIPIAVTAPRRSVAYPNVPTLAELGLGKVDAGTYWGVLAPKGTPDDVVKTLSSLFSAIVKLPEVHDKLEELGYETIGTTPDEYAKQLHDEVDRWGPVVRTIGLSVD